MIKIKKSKFKFIATKNKEISKNNNVQKIINKSK
jgi:hypothetical protein